MNLALLSYCLMLLFCTRVNYSSLAGQCGAMVWSAPLDLCQCGHTLHHTAPHCIHTIQQLHHIASDCTTTVPHTSPDWTTLYQNVSKFYNNCNTLHHYCTHTAPDCSRLFLGFRGCFEGQRWCTCTAQSTRAVCLTVCTIFYICSSSSTVTPLFRTVTSIQYRPVIKVLLVVGFEQDRIFFSLTSVEILFS